MAASSPPALSWNAYCSLNRTCPHGVGHYEIVNPGGKEAQVFHLLIQLRAGASGLEAWICG